MSNIKEGLRPPRSSPADAHIDMAAFWRIKANNLEEENDTLKEKNAALKDQVSQLQIRVSELQGEQLVPIQDSTKSEEDFK